MGERGRGREEDPGNDVMYTWSMENTRTGWKAITHIYIVHFIFITKVGNLYLPRKCLTIIIQ